MVDIESPVSLRVGSFEVSGPLRRAGGRAPASQTAGGRNVKTSTKNDRCAVGGELAPLCRGETYLKHLHWFGKPFEIERAPRIEIKTLPNTEFTYGGRNGDATRRCHSAKSC